MVTKQDLQNEILAHQELLAAIMDQDDNGVDLVIDAAEGIVADEDQPEFVKAMCRDLLRELTELGDPAENPTTRKETP